MFKPGERYSQAADREISIFKAIEKYDPETDKRYGSRTNYFKVIRWV